MPSVPSSVTLGASGAPVRIIPIGVTPAGILEPPQDISDAGWWVSGPRPGGPGRAVLTGHIDSPAGLGAFAALDALHDGDPVSITGADNTVLHYRVIDRQEIQKTSLDPGILTRTSNKSDLLLVTCIGAFDQSSLSYDSNLLITAVPAAP